MQPSLTLRPPRREGDSWGNPLTFEVSPDGKHALRVTKRAFALVDLESGATLWSRERGPSDHGCASFAPDGRSIALGEMGATIVVAARTGRRRSNIKGSFYGAHGVAFSPDGATIDAICMASLVR